MIWVADLIMVVQSAMQISVCVTDISDVRSLYTKWMSMEKRVCIPYTPYTIPVSSLDECSEWAVILKNKTVFLVYTPFEMHADFLSAVVYFIVSTTSIFIICYSSQTFKKTTTTKWKMTQNELYC